MLGKGKRQRPFPGGEKEEDVQGAQFDSPRRNPSKSKLRKISEGEGTPIPRVLGRFCD